VLSVKENPKGGLFMGKRARKKPKKKESMFQAPKIEVELDEKAQMLFEKICLGQQGDEVISEFMEIEQDLRIGILKKLAESLQAQSLAFFSQLIDRGLELTEDIIEELGKIKDGKTVEILLKIYGRNPDKRISKAVRRVLYKLKSQGFSVPDTWEMLLIQEGKELKESAYASPINGLGKRTLWLTSPRPGERIDVRQIEIEDTKGITAYNHLGISKQGFEELLEEKFSAVQIDPVHLRYLVEEAYKKNVESRIPPPKTYLAERDFWQKLDVSMVKPLIYEELNEEEIRKDRGILRDSVDLFNNDDMPKWHLEEEKAKEYARRLKEVNESRLTINEAQKQEQILRALEEATDDYFSQKRREVMKRRLEETALIFFKTGKNEEAKQCLAAALAFGDPSISPRDNPFAMEMMKIGIGSAYEKIEEEESSSLIVLP